MGERGTITRNDARAGHSQAAQSRRDARRGKSIAEVCEALEVSEPTYHRWRNQYGGMKADDAKRLRGVQRLWREEGLGVPARRRKRQRLGESTVPAGRLQAERPGHVW